MSITLITILTEIWTVKRPTKDKRDGKKKRKKDRLKKIEDERIHNRIM